VRELGKLSKPRDVAAIVDAVWRLDSAPNVRELMDFARAPG
jgi:hypothetical protein